MSAHTDVSSWAQTVVDAVGTIITIGSLLWRWVNKLHRRLDRLEKKLRDIDRYARDAVLVAAEGLGMKENGRRWYDREARRSTRYREED